VFLLIKDKMASSPGVWSEWPWQRMGAWKVCSTFASSLFPYLSFSLSFCFHIFAVGFVFWIFEFRHYALLSYLTLNNLELEPSSCIVHAMKLFHLLYLVFFISSSVQSMQVLDELATPPISYFPFRFCVCLFLSNSLSSPSMLLRISDS
jgi:hypothetical protein